MGIGACLSGAVVRCVLGPSKYAEYVATVATHSKTGIVAGRRSLAAAGFLGGCVLLLPSYSFTAVDRDGITFRHLTWNATKHYDIRDIRRIEVTRAVSGGRSPSYYDKYTIVFIDDEKWQTDTTDRYPYALELRAVQYLAGAAGVPIERR